MTGGYLHTQPYQQPSHDWLPLTLQVGNTAVRDGGEGYRHCPVRDQ